MPVGGAEPSGLERLEDAQRLGDPAADVAGHLHDEEHPRLGIEDVRGAFRPTLPRDGRPVGDGDAVVGIRQQGIGDAAEFLRPRTMGVEVVGRASQDLGTGAAEGVVGGGEPTHLGGADEGKVGGVEEEHHPPTPEVAEADAGDPSGGGGGEVEVGRFSLEGEAHGWDGRGRRGARGWLTGPRGAAARSTRDGRDTVSAMNRSATSRSDRRSHVPGELPGEAVAALPAERRRLLDEYLTPEQRALVERHLAELYAWNRRVNLTAIPPEAAWDRHVVDSLRLVDAAVLPASATVVDIGSGAGFPGLVLAIARPDLRVVLLEADRRRCGFLHHVVGLLGLERVGIDCRRAEEAGRDPAAREAFDVAVARAAAAPPTLCEIGLPLVRVGGRLVALVGDATRDAARSRAAARACGGGDPWVAAPGILVVDKLEPTPATFPRRPGLAARRPILAPGDQEGGAPRS